MSIEKDSDEELLAQGYTMREWDLKDVPPEGIKAFIDENVVPVLSALKASGAEDIIVKITQDSKSRVFYKKELDS